MFEEYLLRKKRHGELAFYQGIMIDDPPFYGPPCPIISFLKKAGMDTSGLQPEDPLKPGIHLVSFRLSELK
jgi:hypothetical protein